MSSKLEVQLPHHSTGNGIRSILAWLAIVVLCVLAVVVQLPDGRSVQDSNVTPWLSWQPIFAQAFVAPSRRLP